MSLICSCINVRSMWLPDDMPWSHSYCFIIFTLCCCTWLVCYLLSLNYSANFGLVWCIMATWHSSTTLGRDALVYWYLPGSIHTECCLLGKGIYLGIVCTEMSSSCSDDFLVCSQSIPHVTLMLHICLEFHMMSLSVIVTHVV